MARLGVPTHLQLATDWNLRDAAELSTTIPVRVLVYCSKGKRHVGGIPPPTEGPGVGQMSPQ